MRKLLLISILIIVVGVWFVNVNAQTSSSKTIKKCMGSGTKDMSKDKDCKKSCAFCSMCDDCKAKFVALFKDSMDCCKSGKMKKSKCGSGKGSGSKSCAGKKAAGSGCGSMGMRHMHKKDNFMFIMHHKDEMKLTADQLEKLKSLKFKTKEKIIRLKADIDVLELELKKIISNDNVNLKLLKSKLDNIAKKHAKIKFIEINAKLKAKKVLTEEQHAYIKKMMMKSQGMGCSK